MSGGKDSVHILLISAINEGNLTDVKKLVLSHGLSCCESLHEDCSLLCNTIKSGHFEVAKFLLQQGLKVADKTDDSTPLHFAAQQNCAELVQLLLEKNAPINARNGQNETALHIAAEEGYVEIVKVLLNNNADVTAQTQDGSTPLLLAVERRAGEVVQMLLHYACANLQDEKDLAPSVNSGEKNNPTVLDHVLLCNPSIGDKVNKLIAHIVNLDEGHSQIVDDLIDYGFVLSREYVDEALLLAAVEKKYETLIKSILTVACPSDAEHNLLLLHSAVKNKQQKILELFGSLGFEDGAKSRGANFSSDEDKLVKAVELLLASGANIREFPDLLHTFVEEGMVEVCRVLIANGADVNAWNANKKTPLHVSCNLRAPEHMQMQEWKQKIEQIIRLLLNSGADVNIEDADESTALHTAVQMGRKELVSVLLEFGADVNSRAEDGSTPLHLASNEEIIEILCNHNANLDARNYEGWTPLHCAAYYQKYRVVGPLLKLGADVKVRGPNNETALHFAFSLGCEGQGGWDKGIISLLLWHGCDASAQTNEGRTVLDMAYSKAKSIFDDDREYDKLSGFGSQYVRFIPEDNLCHEDLEAVENVKRHLIILEVAGLCKKSRDGFKTSTNSFSSFRKNCEKEIQRMKNENLNSELTLYDVFVNSKNLTHVKLNSIWPILKSFDFQKYPMYKSLTKIALNRRKLRLDLMSSGQKSLEMLVKTSSRLSGKKCTLLPVQLSELIISYLSNGDLKSLISCSDVLKRQLSL